MKQSAFMAIEMENEKIGLQIEAMTIEQQQFITPFHWHDHMQVYYFVSGQALVHCGSETYTAVAPTAFCINNNEIHCIENKADQTEFYIIRFWYPYLGGGPTDLYYNHYIVPLIENKVLIENLIGRDKKVMNCLQFVVKEYDERKVGYELVIRGKANELLGLLYRSHLKKVMTDKEYQLRELYYSRLKEVVRFIEAHLNEPLRVEDLASIAGISDFHFCRVFKTHTGMTSSEYINRVRISEAIRLMPDLQLNITDISLRVGFEDANYFSRTFKKYSGMSPRAFRKSILK